MSKERSCTDCQNLGRVIVKFNDPPPHDYCWMCTAKLPTPVHRQLKEPPFIDIENPFKFCDAWQEIKED